MGERIKIVYCYTNQKVIQIKKTISDESHLYSIVNVEAAMNAAKQLSDNAFKMYARLMLHQDGFTFALSPNDIRNGIGMSESKYRKAVKELTEKRYLVLQEGSENIYTAYEYPERDGVPLDEAECPDECHRSQEGPYDRAKIEGAYTTFPVDGVCVSGREIIQDNTTDTIKHNTVDRGKDITPHITKDTTCGVEDDPCLGYGWEGDEDMPF